MNNIKTNYTPALGTHNQTQNYDKVLAVMAREYRWRGRMLADLAPKPNQTILDIGSGTGSFAILVKQESPKTRVVAVDPDPEIRQIAESKAKAANVTIKFVTAMGDETIDTIGLGGADAVTISLVLHQCPTKVKEGILANAYRMLKPRGRILISDYGKQRSLLMSMLFNQVRMVDGYEDTRANKDGLLPEFMSNAGFQDVDEAKVTQTPTGSISLYRGRKPS